MQVATAATLIATIRHGFDITPLNSRCTPTAWPNRPTYATISAIIATQYAGST